MAMVIGVLSSLLIQVHPPAARADTLSGAGVTCFERAMSKLRRGDWIRVVSRDTAIVTGRLHSVYPEQSLLTVWSFSEADTARLTFNGADVDMIQYRGGGKYAAIGAGCGAVLGVLALAIDMHGRPEVDSWLPGYEERKVSYYLAAALVGGLLGFVSGTVVSIITPPVNTIRCRSQEDRHSGSSDSK